MKERVRLNIRTFAGQKQILNELKQSLNTIDRTKGVKGLKSVSYHKRRINELLEGLEKRDEKALKSAIKYSLRGGEHQKPIDIRKDARGVQFFYGAANGTIQRNHSTIINSYADFVRNWDEIKDVLKGFGKGLKNAIFGAGYGYVALRDRLSQALGLSIGEFLNYLQQSRDLYNGEYQDIANAKELAKSNEQIASELLSKYWWWGVKDLDDLLDVAFEGRLVGRDFERILKW